jgi:selenocysteine-specific elongation factor
MSTTRKNIMLGTAGHVDHGKSALVRLLTGCETDTLAEEKQRGLTIDLGFAPCRLADARIVGVVDVPGHVDFIRNMVAGAHGIDVAILVVAADDGIMPQTHEHLHILTLMGLRHGLVALTKIDLVDADRRVKVIDDLRFLLAGTFLEHAPICPISNVTGDGFEGFFDALNQVVDACEERPSSGVFRVWVDDAFTIRGSGTVITGIPVAGTVRIGDRLTLLPGGQAGHVRQMQVYGEVSDVARAGECVALNVPELDYQQVHRGMVLCEAAAGLAPVTMAEAEFVTLTSLPGVIKDYVEVQMHLGTAAALAHVAMLESGEMAAQQRQMVQLRLKEPLPMRPGERFVLRANLGGAAGGLMTIGGGRILGVSNARLRRQKQWTLDLLAARCQVIDDPVGWCEQMLRESPQGLAAPDLARQCGRHLADLEETLKSLRTAGRVAQSANGIWHHAKSVQEAADRLRNRLRDFHTAHPERAGADRAELLKQLAFSSEFFEMVAAQSTQQRQIVAQGTVLALADWKPKLANPDERLATDVAEAYQKAKWNCPAPGDLAATFRVPVERVEKVVRLMIDRGILVRLDDRVSMHRDAIAAGKEVALRLFRTAPSFSTMEFRDALSVSRKFAVPLLDYLDKVRFTVRSGHNRTPGAEAKVLLK